MRTACQDPGFRSGIHIRLRCPEIGGHGQLWHRFLHFLTVHIIDDQAETIAQIDQGCSNAVSLLGSKYQSGGILSVSHGQRLAFDADRTVRNSRTDFQHMSFQNTLFSLDQIIGIVLQHGSTLGILHSPGHDLHQTHHGCYFPVAFRTEAVAFLHQPLDRQSR